MSVSDKTGIVEFAQVLVTMGIEIISTGGTARSLKNAGILVTTVDQVTGFPEMLDGRVKTLHPKIHGALLALRDVKSHMDELTKNGIGLIDMVVVNLYPFNKTVEKPGVNLEEAIENIDIGGPTMLRSSAKNYRFVAPVTDPADYPLIINELKKNGTISEETRKYLAVKVFRHTADYDSAIDTFLSERLAQEHIIRLSFTGGTPLRYGENWHQKGMFYKYPHLDYPSLANAEQLWGKQLSYNNYIDMTSAVMSVKDFVPSPAVSVIKHTNPCGLATGKSCAPALKAAWDGDRISAFGSVIACTVPFDGESAEFLQGKMVEAIIAPDFTTDAISLLEKKKNIMLVKLAIPEIGTLSTPVFRQVLGGIVMQNPDTDLYEKWDVVTKTAFPESKKDLALFTMTACKYTKSNAIVLGEEYESGCYRVLGMGAGQPNRVDSLRKLSATKARENLDHTYSELSPRMDRETWIKERLGEAVLASDAFFPFDDTVREAHTLGIRYIIQPGGSVKDDEVIAAANELGIAMIFTGMRHFLH